jgi:hypothetical protein
MSPILERALAPVVVTMIWVMAILMLVRETAGGIAPMIAGLIGGVALVLQACLGGESEIRRVFGLRAGVTAALAFLAFLGGCALALAMSDKAAAREIVEIWNTSLSLGLLAALLMRLGIALALAAILAEASLALLEEGAS